MANLKDLKTRINSVKSTQKITAAMKMVVDPDAAGDWQPCQ